MIINIFLSKAYKMSQGQSLIWIIEDNEALGDILLIGFQAAFPENEFVLFEKGEDALEQLKETHPEIVVLDIKLPGMNGLDVLKHIKESSPHTEVIMMTAYATLDSSITALRYGAFDFVLKPFELTHMQDVLKKALNAVKIKETKRSFLEEKFPRGDSLKDVSVQQALQTLLNIVEAWDPDLQNHAKAVKEYSIMIGKAIGLDENDLIKLGIAANFHDIGKIGVPYNILNKPGKLKGEELKAIRNHYEIGARILNSLEPMRDIIPIIRHHHEWYNGEGYPDGLKGEEIPLLARIIAIADAYDAMIRERSYRPSLGIDTAKEELKKNAGTQFDPKLIEIFLKLIEEKGEDI